MKALFAFWIAHRGELAALLGQHIARHYVDRRRRRRGVPLGIFSARRPRLASPLIGLASVVQTIPSLAMFGFCCPCRSWEALARAALVFDSLRAAADRPDDDRRPAKYRPRHPRSGCGDGDDAP
jgi:ABC-type proline/glycine betaine transport system permease subunit